MKEFSPLQAPFLSFYSAPFYRDLLRNGKGMGFAYLFLLLILVWSLQTVKIGFAMQNMTKDPELNTFIAQVPELKVENGKMSMDKPSPYKITDKKGRTMIYFDMSGETKTLEAADGAKVLVTENSFLAEKSNGVEQSMPWSKIGSEFSVNQEMIKGWVQQAPVVITGIVWAAGIFVFIGHLLLALIFGLLGLIFDSQKLGYMSMVRLACFAMTPAIMLSMIQSLSGLNIPMFNFISLAMTLGFIYFGNSSVKEA